MSTAARDTKKLSVAEFEAIFDQVKNWDRWGPDDVRGTLNYLTPEHVKRAASLVRSGRSISMAIPINTVAGPDNPSPAIHHMTQMHDWDINSGKLRFATDFLGMNFHGDCHTHIDALCHIAYADELYGGRPASLVTSHGAEACDEEQRWEFMVVAIPDELDAAEEAQGVKLEEGDILVFRTGHHRRRRELGAWDNGPDGEGKAGLHVDTIPWMHERKIAAFLPDGDGETVPSTVDGITYPIHPLQIVAMGMAVSDSLNLEEIAEACDEEQRWEFMVVAIPLRLPRGTGSPFNPIAIL